MQPREMPGVSEESPLLQGDESRQNGHGDKKVRLSHPELEAFLINYTSWLNFHLRMGRIQDLGQNGTSLPISE
jgi:hypothetical protein